MRGRLTRTCKSGHGNTCSRVSLFSHGTSRPSRVDARLTQSAPLKLRDTATRYSKKKKGPRGIILGNLYLPRRAASIFYRIVPPRLLLGQYQFSDNSTMAPSEAKILENYLLLPAQLPTILSLEEFIAFFPRQLQSSPQIRSLYRDLQSQRNTIVDSVAERIEAQVRKGKAIRREVIAAKRQAESRDHDAEIELERMVRFVPCERASQLKLTSRSWLGPRLVQRCPNTL